MRIGSATVPVWDSLCVNEEAESSQEEPANPMVRIMLLLIKHYIVKEYRSVHLMTYLVRCPTLSAHVKTSHFPYSS